MLYVTNVDIPGMIGLLGTICGKHNVNIANFSLGRNHPGGDAIAMLYVDDRIPQAVLDELIAQEAIKAARPLEFNIEEA
ncbi:hypothetical protein D3C79_1039210 [compost metagenome]